MTILVTGAAGFIGSNFCHWLIDNTRHTVIGVDNLYGGYMSNMPRSERYLFYNMDVRYEEFNNKISSTNVSVAYILACYAAEGRSNHIGFYIHDNNTLGVSNAINICVNNNIKMIFSSSVAVYSGIPPFTENTDPCPVDFYGNSKLSSEREIGIAGNIFGLEWSIVRPRNVYGERQSLWDTARNVMGIWCYQALHNKPITVFGDGSNKRCFTYVGDIMQPLYNAMKYDRQSFNLGSPKAYSIKEAAEMFCEITGHDKIQYLEPRHEVPEAVCLTDKSEQLLDYKHKTDLYEGLKKMWEWAKIQPDREIQMPPALEITKNTHSSLL